MMFDFNRFFQDRGGAPGVKSEYTDQVIERTPVTSSDIDSVNYVPGSEGNVKEISLVFEDNVEKRNTDINLKKKVFLFKYEEIEFPNFPTSIEKIEREEVE